MNVVTELKDAWDGVVAKWRRDRRAAEDARIEGGTALFAVAQDSPEGDIQAATQRAAWANQIKLIEQMEHRERKDGLLLAQLRRNIHELDKAEALRHPTPENMAGRRLADFGAVGGARGFLGSLASGGPWLAILGSPLTWVAIGLATFGVQTARITHLHHDLDDARGAARQNAQAAHTWETRSHAYEQATADAQAAAHITTQTLEAERRRVAAAAAREQRRQREIANVNAGAEPPNWDSSLRGDSAPEDQPSPAAPAANSNPS